MKIKDFVKKNYEIFVVNFIVLGFIVFALLAQFGVHIKVDKSVDLIPDEIQYIQSTEYLRRQGTAYASVCYVRLKYKSDEKISFWVPASIVFGRASDDEINEMIKDGDPIKRNVFFNTRSYEVIGVTKSGKTILSLYYYNSRIFRYGIWILILCDLFVGFLIKSKHKKNVDV